MTPHNRTPGALDRAVSLVEGICLLPAIATPTWADQAAQALTRAHPRSLACVLVGQIGASGSIDHLETAGAHAGPSVADSSSIALSLRSAVERLGELGIEPTQISGLAAPADTLLGPGWARRGIGAAWPACEGLVIGIHPIGPRDLNRYIVAGIELVGSTGTNPADVHTCSDLLGAVLPLLAKRALLAIGAKVSGSSRWLTDREQAVLERLALGLSVREIAEEIGRSPHTVHDHVKSLHRKLGASSRGELVARALGYIDDANRVLGSLAGTVIEPKPTGTPVHEGVRAAALGNDTITEHKPNAVPRHEK